VTWLSDDEQRTWRRFAAVLELLPQALDAQLQRDADISHFSYWIMAMLSEAPGRSLRMAELAERTHASQSRLSHMVARLEEQGLVRRERCASDARGSVAVLTEAGVAKIERSAPDHVETVRSLVFDPLTPAQIDQLAEISTALGGKLARRGT
jgi:DNA-binding MarR family transcriptional regulator